MALLLYKEVSGKAVPYVVGPRREGDVAVCYADTSKAAKQLGWVARRTLNDMCRGRRKGVHIIHYMGMFLRCDCSLTFLSSDAWNWQSKNPNGYITFKGK